MTCHSWAPKRVVGKKTQTLDQGDDNPTHTICLGHVTATEFNDAFRTEGWKRGDWIYKENLSHEYWVKIEGGWKQSIISDRNAVAVTVMRW